MKLKLRLPKVDISEVFTHLALLGIVAAVAFVGFYWGFSRLGLFSYNALSKQQVDAQYAEFMRRYKSFSHVEGDLPIIGHFARGVVTGPDAAPGYPLYYHYTTNGQEADFQIYPLGVETWTTSPGLFGVGKLLTGAMK